jgi:DNA-binding NarL/FixJ family response regulator
MIANSWRLRPGRHKCEPQRETLAARILIADDNPVVRKCVGRLLCGHQDWEVCGEAADGEQAVRLAKELAPDVLVLDFSMPGINGLEAARQIGRVSPKTAILLCTIFLSPQLVDLARAVGVAGTLGKGDLNRMVVGIETILRGNRFFYCDNRLM